MWIIAGEYAWSELLSGQVVRCYSCANCDLSCELFLETYQHQISVLMGYYLQGKVGVGLWPGIESNVRSKWRTTNCLGLVSCLAFCDGSGSNPCFGSTRVVSIFPHQEISLYSRGAPILSLVFITCYRKAIEKNSKKPCTSDVVSIL